MAANVTITSPSGSATVTVDDASPVTLSSASDSSINVSNTLTASVTGGASTVTTADLTASRALASNSSGKIVVSAVTDTELGYLDGVSSAIQTQLNAKASSLHTHAINDLSDVNTSGLATNQYLSWSGSAFVPTTLAAVYPIWGQQASTSLWHLFEDFLAESTTTGSTWWSGAVNSSGALAGSSSASSAATFGVMEMDATDTVDSYAVLTSCTLSKASPSNGEVVIFEANLKPDVSGDGEVSVVVGGFEVNSDFEDDVYGFKEYGGSTTPHRVVVGWLDGQSNFRYYSGNATDASSSTSDTSVTAASSFTRFAVKLTYSSSGSNWAWTAYVNGSSVGTGTLDGTYQLAAQVVARGTGSGKTAYCDWMHAQFERGTVSLVS
mgnify:CR=1 FL=1